jgi:hypothetical protein
MRAYKTKTFHRWASKAGITELALLDAVVRMERGLIDADLGGNIYKQRVALPGRGKSSSARTIIATQFAGKLFFLYGFEKSERDNISQKELEALKAAGSVLLVLSEEGLQRAMAHGELKELSYE